MEERNLNTWEEFEEALKDIRKEHDKSDAKTTPLLFRGQENSCWRLRTTLELRRERMLFADYYGLIARIRPQIETPHRERVANPRLPRGVERRTGL